VNQNDENLFNVRNYINFEKKPSIINFVFSVVLRNEFFFITFYYFSL